MNLRKGECLLRLTAVTPSNFGSFGGNATVDRPVCTDPWHSLPYIPASALKGVVAGRFGNLPSDGSSSSRADLFGRPDGDGAGAGGNFGAMVVLGDGDLLCFPVPLRNERIGWVFPAHCLARFLKLLEVAEIPNLIRLEDKVSGTIPVGLLPGDPQESNLAIDPRSLSGLFGDPLPPRYVVAGPGPAAALWRHAVEERVLTAVDTDTGVVSGSLRRIELVPSGTRFLSFVSSRADACLPDLSHLQVGAWEAIGLGYLRLSSIATGSPSAGSEEEITGQIDLDGMSAGRESEATAMKNMYQLVQSAGGKGEQSRKIRAAIRTFGPRWRTRGLSATIAFSLARARLRQNDGKRGTDARAHGWLLHALLANGEKDNDALLENAARIVTHPAGAPASLETRWRWLRRYSETLLPELTDQE